MNGDHLEGWECEGQMNLDEVKPRKRKTAYQTWQEEEAEREAARKRKGPLSIHEAVKKRLREAK